MDAQALLEKIISFLSYAMLFYERDFPNVTLG